MSIDYSFLKTGSKWSDSEVTNLEYGMPTTNPVYYLTPIVAAIHTVNLSPFTETPLTSDFNVNNYDQQDIIRYLLESKNGLLAYSGINSVNTILLTTVNTNAGDGRYENYRVSFPDVAVGHARRF